MRQSGRQSRQRECGNRHFSLVEVVVVLVLLGIMVAVVVSRAGGHEADLPVEAAILKAHLRYAQTRALADTVPWGVSLASGQYTLLRDGVAAGQLPGEDGHTHALQGVTMSTGTGSLTFNSWGEPSISGVLLSANHTITLSAGGSSRSVVVTKNTGFVN